MRSGLALDLSAKLGFGSYYHEIYISPLTILDVALVHLTF